MFSTARNTIRPTSHCFVYTYPRILLRTENQQVMKGRLKGVGRKTGSNPGLVSCVPVENVTNLSYVCKCVIELLVCEKIDTVSFLAGYNDMQLYSGVCFKRTRKQRDCHSPVGTNTKKIRSFEIETTVEILTKLR